MSEEKNWYFEHELYPAIDFSRTEEGRDWIENHFPYLVERIYEKGDELLGYETVRKIFHDYVIFYRIKTG